jgi:hypothetical protein
LFPLFNDLEVKDLDKPVGGEKTDRTGEVNGVGTKPNGVENIPLTNGSAERQ